MKNLDTIKMLTEIDNIVNNDFGLTMSDKLHSGKRFTQEEAKKMASKLGEVYKISHCIHCDACSRQFIKGLHTSK